MKRLLNNHHGISLLELLVAIFLSSIALGLAAQMLTLFITSSQTTIIANQANTQATYNLELIDSRIRNFNPTTISLCGEQENCVVFEQHFEFLVTESGIDVIYHDTPKTLKIEFLNGQIILTREIGTPTILEFQGFTLSDLSAIQLINFTPVLVDGQKISIIFEIVLESKGKSYMFSTSYALQVDLI